MFLLTWNRCSLELLRLDARNRGGAPTMLAGRFGRVVLLLVHGLCFAMRLDSMQRYTMNLVSGPACNVGACVHVLLTSPTETRVSEAFTSSSQLRMWAGVT